MNILIIKLGALGDIIISTSIIKKIINHHSKDTIYLLTTPNFKDLFNAFKKVNVVSFDRRGLKNFINTVAWIRKKKFNRIYDLQSNDRTSLYCALSNATYCAGNHPRFPYNFHPEEKYRGQCHSFERLNQIIVSAGISPAKPKPSLPATADAISKVDKWIKKHGLEAGNFIIIHAGSSKKHLSKRWPYFAELAATLSKNIKIVWIGGNDDIELNQHLSEFNGINATNEFDVLCLAELGRKAKFAITNDSAPMHILSCSAIPIYTLFGPTNPKRTHALGQNKRVISVSSNFPLDDSKFTPDEIFKIKLSDVLEKIKRENLIK